MGARHIIGIFLFAILGTGTLIFFGLMSFDAPPPYVDPPQYRFTITTPPMLPDFIEEQLWLAQCDKYEREEAEGGTKYSIISVDSSYGIVMRMDCRGNIEWPHGQEIGAMYLALGLKEWW